MSATSIQAERQRLIRRIESRYRLVTETVRIGALTFPFTRVADPDKVLDEVAAEEDRLEKVSGKRVEGDYLHLPYWAELWDSAAGIGEQLQRIADIDQLSVLDLGCGMGLTGTVAARLGATVLFADLEPPALMLARLNSLDDSSRVRTRRLDWRTDRLDERFDLIIGADILYERKQWDHLEPFWRSHLADEGRILLGEPGRPTGDAFAEWIGQRDWHLTTCEQPVPTRARPIRVFTLSQNATSTAR